MTIADGRSCVRGIRFANIQFRGLTLVSRPQFGEVELQGAGFIYSPNVNFHGRDMFSLAVTGVVNGKPGNSTIQVTVSDNSSGALPADGIPSDTTPPSVAFTAPAEGATISGPGVVLTATASGDVAVANVRFFLAGKKIGSTLTSPPYTTTWDSTTIADGFYTLIVVAQDKMGNADNSWVHVTVKNK
jgi:hypothetical protein